MNLVYFALEDMRHQKSGVWAAEEGSFCLRTRELITMKPAQYKVDSLYNMLWLLLQDLFLQKKLFMNQVVMFCQAIYDTTPSSDSCRF